MLKSSFRNWKKRLFKIRSFLAAKLSQGLINLLMKTCRVQVQGLEQFCRLAANEKCILMLWHNHLVIVPFILSRYTPQIQYAAIVSGSRDGDILSMIVHSYKNGNTIRVPHLARYQALQEIIRQIESQKHVVIITPDGPRGPVYEMKPGLAIAALETQANVVSLNWKSKTFWELKTWDRLRIPMPFTTIQVSFEAPIRLENFTLTSLEEARAFLKERLPQD